MQVPVQGRSARTNSFASSTVTRELAVITKTLLEESLSNASVSVYKRPWKLFTDWSASYLGDMPINLPLQPAILALFIAHLYSRSYSSSSVTTYISAISYVHKLAGVADPTETPLIIQI